MTHPNNLAYQQFVKLFIEANQSERKSKQVLISEAMTCWKTNIKKSQKDPFDRSAFDQQIDSLRKKIEDRKRKQSIEFCLYGYMDIGFSGSVCIHSQTSQAVRLDN